MQTVAIIQARLGSQRLPGKVALRLGQASLLETVVRRVQACRRLVQVVVAAGDAAENRALAALVPPGVPLFFGSEHDVLARYAAALERYPAEGVLRVCADNPLLDAALIDELLQAAAREPACDYASHRLADGTPAIQTPVGVFAEWIAADALRRAARLARVPADRENVTRYFYTHPADFRLCWLAAPRELARDDVRLTVDFADDWEHVRELYATLEPQALAWPQVLDWLAARPDVRQRMRELNLACPKERLRAGTSSLAGLPALPSL